MWLAAGALQSSSLMLPHQVAQGLLDHSQTACSCRLALARLNKPCRILLKMKRVTSPLGLRYLRYPFALEQPVKGYVLRGQGQSDSRVVHKPSFPAPDLRGFLPSNARSRRWSTTISL